MSTVQDQSSAMSGTEFSHKMTWLANGLGQCFNDVEKDVKGMSKDAPDLESIQISNISKLFDHNYANHPSALKKATEEQKPMSWEEMWDMGLKELKSEIVGAKIEAETIKVRAEDLKRVNPTDPNWKEYNWMCTFRGDVWVLNVEVRLSELDGMLKLVQGCNI